MCDWKRTYGDWVVDVEFHFAEDEFFVCHLGESLLMEYSDLVQERGTWVPQ